MKFNTFQENITLQDLIVSRNGFGETAGTQFGKAFGNTQIKAFPKASFKEDTRQIHSSLTSL